ncbi:MAG: ATP-binding cassette domain-containing protein [Burkholderiaceae bacterium]
MSATDREDAAPTTPAPPATDLSIVLQEVLARMCPDRALVLPRWASGAESPRAQQRLLRWLAEKAGIALADNREPLAATLGSGAHLVLALDGKGHWRLIDCREGVATLWSGHGAGIEPVASLDAGKLVRLVTVRPAQDLSPRLGSRADRQPWLLPFLREYRGRLVELVLTGLLVNGIGLLLPLFTMLVYDKVVGNQANETLWALAIGLALFVGLELVMRSLRTHTVESIACRVDAAMERRLLDRLFAPGGPMPPVGVMLARYRDFQSARDFVSSNWLLALADAPFVAVFLTAIALVGGAVVWAPLLAGLALVGVHALLHQPSNRYAELATQSQARKMTALAEILGAGELVRATPLRWALGRRFSQQAEDTALALARGRYWTHLGQHVATTVVTLCAIAVLIIGVYRIEARELSIGGLIACSMLSGRAVMMLSGLSSILTRWRELRRAMRSLDALLAEADDGAAIDPGSTQWSARGNDLRMRGVCFGHDAQRRLLTDLDLEIPGGQFVVVLGRPGAGKTTLLKLLGGLWRPSQGEVLLGGHSIVDWPAPARAAGVAVKPQDAVLFEGTLAENIVGGADAIVKPERFAEALAVSGLDQWIARGELSLSQRLLPGGANLSGGQRQLVALARSLAISAPVVLLDEPTVGLDQATEAGIVARLRAWAEGRTLVVATHSAALVAAADRVIVLDGGRVVGDGPPSRVLATAPAAQGANHAPPGGGVSTGAATAPAVPAARRALASGMRSRATPI